MPDSTFRSFHSLSVKHPGFAIHPRLWTSHHLSIVNCTFQQVETGDAYVPVGFYTQTAERLAESAKKLARGDTPDTKFLWVESLLLREGTSPIAFITTPLSFYYGKRRVRLADSHVHIFCIKEEISIPHVDPVMGYYRYNADEQRQKRFRAPRAPSGLNNNPVQRKYDTRYRKVTPEDLRKDPYLVCILLSLAQLQHRKSYGPRGLFLARLLVTHLADHTDAYVYKADIPHQLLESLDHPTRSIEDFDFPTVRYVKVPFKPYSTFAERVQIHLAGAEYSPRPEPGRSDQVASSEPRGKKRKRDE
ncbi:uncharacterized protein BKA55DRAFT_697339 [Fusarium redolens]|uniref:Uncharacterized protein n=1 Tax=Fusarium redolens TaxID=48865 RepID=A0A9P9FYZ0_FUSRE|nr:uncharacterized protein BKA55DRAFT_697339 [Fusarium redolens]KAH7222564.1 hypothetical protein BKA55DRAFT_697339 [Fusarium redolens]